MAQFCCLLNLLLLLLMLWRVPVIDTRPTRDRPQSDLIAGNEFLKLFLERDELQRDLHSGEFEAVAAKGNGDDDISGKSHATSRSTSARSLDYKARNGMANSNQDAGKQVVKLVTSGSKIVFLEEYDDDDAVVDAVARDIDLQKEHVSTTTAKTVISQQQQQQRSKSTPSDEVKVVAVSVSSSSQRGSPSRARLATASNADRRQQHQQAQVAARTTAPNSRAALVTSTLPSTSIAATADFINRSHKSEFSIEEAEPLTMLQQHKTRKLLASAATASADALDDGGDSQNSASTNIHNVLAALPLSGDSSAYRGSNSTSLNQAAPINQTPSAEHEFDAHSAVDMPSASARSMGVEEKLLPFQTVIYHDTQEGHGPQSRSISYSSLSQNVEDLRAWQQQSAGILAEAQFNVSESLKPATRSQTQTHTSEPAKFYSVPAKMYGVPSKFYSEPAKVYSEPAKVYGQPEKFYSEPAKVYSQPAKFYSEPAKVYSQPAKVYSEPAKNYWPNPPALSTTTTTQAPKPAVVPSSRRPAIVSRIAFGEAQTTTAAPTKFQPHSSAAKPSTFQQHHRPHTYQHSHANQPTQPRRVLFNLDKLPYDLLNAPQQSSKPLLEPDLSKHVPALAPAAFASAHQRPCLESTFSSPALPLPNAQHQHQQQQQRQQHSSLSSNQHSNQNAKGLPNRDLVKCVAQFAHSSAPPTHFTTESSRHIDELYTPTPEQNYEIEESVSVMTNGRAHGVQGIGSTTTTTTTTTTAAPVARQQPTRSRMRYGDGTNANANVAGAVHGDGSENHSNSNRHNHNYNNNYDDEEDVDAAGHKSDIGTGYDGDGDGDGDAEDGNSNGDGGDDDSKVAYVVEGRNYRKYRVEEKTDDGFIVGEYGVVDHNDGNLRGVRYTADSTINRSLIQKALLTFLKLK